MPSAISDWNSGRRAGSLSWCTPLDHGSRPSPFVTGRSCGPNESVVPPACQQIEPAETPVRTTPACHASRITPSRPCSRHSASNPATLPPHTQITSWDSRCPARSGMFGIGISATWLPAHPSRHAFS